MPGVLAGFTAGAQRKVVQLEFDVLVKTERLKHLQAEIRNLRRNFSIYQKEMKAATTNRIAAMRGERGWQGRAMILNNQMNERLKKQKGMVQERIGDLQHQAALQRDTLADRKQGLGLLSREIRETGRFRFEWLGLMFAGVALQRVFGGYVKQMTDMLGITKLISTTFTILLLPVLTPFIQVFASLLGWVAGLTDEQKKWIGSLILAVTVVGALAMIIGSAALAINSIVGLIDKMVPEEALNNVEVLGISLGEVPGAILESIMSFGVLGGVAALFGGTVAGVTLLVKKLVDGLDGVEKEATIMDKAVTTSFGDAFVEIGKLTAKAGGVIWDILTGKKSIKGLCGLLSRFTNGIRKLLFMLMLMVTV